jgi:ferritin-like metal-binding protein YciE
MVRGLFATCDTPLVEHLTHLHEVERLDLRVLELGCRAATDGVTSEIYSGHAHQTRAHLRLLEERLAAHDAAVAGPEDGCVRAGVLRVELDTKTGPAPGELAVAAYTLENLEIGLYHVLCALARQAHDHPTEVIAQQILEQEESAAELIASRLHREPVSVG